MPVNERDKSDYCHEKEVNDPANQAAGNFVRTEHDSARYHFSEKISSKAREFKGSYRVFNFAQRRPTEEFRGIDDY